MQFKLFIRSPCETCLDKNKNAFVYAFVSTLHSYCRFITSQWNVIILLNQSSEIR